MIEMIAFTFFERKKEKTGTAVLFSKQYLPKECKNN
jgi:hypothetical protein